MLKLEAKSARTLNEYYRGNGQGPFKTVEEGLSSILKTKNQG